MKYLISLAFTFLIALAIFRIYMITLGDQKKVNKWSYVDEKIAKNEDN